MALTQSVEIPESRQITLSREVPTGRANIVIFPVREVETVQQTVSQESFAEQARKYVEEQKRKAEIDMPPERRGFGCLKGEIWMADDFDEPLEDFKDYM